MFLKTSQNKLLLLGYRFSNLNRPAIGSSRANLTPLSYFFDSSIVGESSGLHMETIQASEPSTLDMVAGTDKDEVQVRKLPKLSFLSGC